MSHYKYVLALSCLLLAGLCHADERILNYHSDVLIHVDGSVMVTETIRVRAEGQSIRKGIYRDFPTAYTDRLGNHYQVGFKVLDVKRNGQPEAYHTEHRANGVRVYIGSTSRILKPGIYAYRLRYQTTRQLGFFEDHDELYWNVTGNGWRFPIDHASARIKLPADVNPGQLRTDFYTGPRGAAGKAATSRIISHRTVRFKTSRGLQPGEGLTVAVGFPKGIVQEPSRAEKIGYFFADNGAALILLLGILLPLGWYLWAWGRYGRDPQKGIIIPRFKPPTGLSAAGCAYIRKMSFGKQAFAAAIVSLGVKGYLEILEDDDEFTLRQKPASARGKASKGEHIVVAELFKTTAEIELKQENYKVFMRARAGLNKALKTEYFGRTFNLNSRYALPAVAMTIGAAVIAANLGGGPLLLFVFAVLSSLLHGLFLFLLRAPTPAGRRIMDEIEGLKMYLETAEQERLERMQSPQLTPEVFESFLPYAFALGVENHWCDRFAREFPQDLQASSGYQPGWYVGSHSGLAAMSHLGSDFSSNFSTAISSASSPPGGSSGSGGGGFSGGGGGGGGGGGW